LLVARTCNEVTKHRIVYSGIVKTPDRAYVILPLLKKERTWAYYRHAINMELSDLTHPTPAGSKKLMGILTEYKVRDNIIEHRTRIINTRFVDVLYINA